MARPRRIRIPVSVLIGRGGARARKVRVPAPRAAQPGRLLIALPPNPKAKRTRRVRRFPTRTP
jgi:hypothetical protein